MGIGELRETLNRMVNDQFDTPEFTHFFSVRWTLPRAKFYVIHNALYVSNRRDCWGYVQGGSPLEVKALIWKHEEDELIKDPRCDTDHFTLCIKQGEVVGLKEDEIRQAEPIPSVRAAFYAWTHLAKDSPWLEAFTASSILERRNNSQIVKGGGMSARLGQRWIEDMGFKWEQMPAKDVHRNADVAHSDMMEGVFERYAAAEAERQAVIRAAYESLQIDRAFRGALADAMERVN